MAEEEEDEELAAIRIVLGALASLKPEARNNVIDYVFRRLGITAPAPNRASSPASEPPVPISPGLDFHPPSSPAADLRSLRDQKQPNSANQMVAIVAYYLANLAPAEERRDYIVSDDIKKYFLQAGFELPTGPPSQTLVNAKNAGYLDALATGRYRLNPVGHNLVTHKLPSGEGTPLISRGRGSNKKVARKKKKVRK